MSSRKRILHMTLSAMMLALALLLPFVTGQIPQIGASLCPMHLPILLCGFFCGPFWGAAIGFIAPFLRFMIFGMPPLIPSGVGMAFELATYGFMAGLLYQILPKKRIYIYVSLLLSMLAGRVVWGVVRVILYGLGKSSFGWKIFIANGFTSAIPGIIAQIILVPAIVMAVYAGRYAKADHADHNVDAQAVAQEENQKTA